ncbi:MAG TPA: methylated-DNA--[protein]-cysteine S-methyltransferase [Chloroflexota bacterium]|nr:methylated-DNA--[protein]-cysteine S-methyltransferase [Chloroflexota bacterium]
MMSEVCYALFRTEIGTCAIAWGQRGVLAIELPASDDSRTRARILRRWPVAAVTAPPDDIRCWIGEIVALLEGETRGLHEVALDMTDVPEFNRRVYEVARAIPPGSTRTYGDIATDLGDPLLARAVGQALGQNPFPIVIPCHRVTAAHGSIGGFSAPGGAHTKVRMLAIEGVQVGEQLALF